MIGRGSTIFHLSKKLEDTQAGTGSALVIDGLPGMGKSQLLHELARCGAAVGLAVAAGSATALDRLAPLATLQTLLHPLGLVVPTGPTATNRIMLLDQMQVAIEAYARERPVLMLLDDAQWADESSVLALRTLVPALASFPVLWVFARRCTPTRGQAQQALDWLVDDDVERLVLSPLTDEDIGRVCANLLGAEPDAAVLSLAARSEGNPFLLEELLTTSLAAGRIVVHGDTATVIDDDLAPDFLCSVERGVADLSDDARRLLDVGAVLRRPFTVHEVAALIGRAAVDLVPVVDEVLGSSVLIEHGAELSFRYDLIREALYGQLPAAVRLALHREAAGVVAAEGRPAVECAEHLIRSQPCGSEAIRFLRKAVEEFAPAAPEPAADQILRLLKLVDENHLARPRLVADAVRLLQTAGRVVEARQLAESALSGGLDLVDESALLFCLAEASYLAGDNPAVVEHSPPGLSTKDVPDGNGAERYAIQTYGLLDRGVLSDAQRASDHTIAIGTACGKDAAWVCGRSASSVVARIRGRLTESVTRAWEAVRLADAVGGGARYRNPRLWLVPALAAVDNFVEADTVCAVGRQEADQQGSAWSRPIFHYYRAELRMAAGQLDDAQAEAEAGIRVAEQLSAKVQLVTALQAILTVVAVLRGKVDTASAHLRRAERLVAAEDSVTVEESAWARALLLEAVGEHAGAREACAGIVAALPGRALALVREPRTAVDLVRIGLRVGDRAMAAAAADGVTALAARNPTVPSLAGAAAHARGLLDEDRTQLERAVQAYETSPRPLSRALAAEDLATAEHTAGRWCAAERLREQAAEIYRSCGATRAEARVRAHLRRPGNRAAPPTSPPTTVSPTDARRVPSAGPGSTWASLTRSELRVARLIAEGLTNREAASRLFLSPHTVDSHLRHCFAKLGITSRVMLTRVVLAHDAQDQ